MQNLRRTRRTCLRGRCKEEEANEHKSEQASVRYISWFLIPVRFVWCLFNKTKQKQKQKQKQYNKTNTETATKTKQKREK